LLALDEFLLSASPLLWAEIDKEKNKINMTVREEYLGICIGSFGAFNVFLNLTYLNYRLKYLLHKNLPFRGGLVRNRPMEQLILSDIKFFED
jgi:hypothetical protein